MYAGQPAGSNGVLYREVHCIQDSQLGPSGVSIGGSTGYRCSQLGPSGVLYTDVYTGQPAGSQWCPL